MTHSSIRCRLDDAPRHAVHVIRLTAFDLNLYCRMADPELPLDVIHHRPQDLLPFANALVTHHNMTATCDDTWADGPDVQVMHVENTTHTPDHVNNGGHVCPGRRPFQDYGDALAQHPPARP